MRPLEQRHAPTWFALEILLFGAKARPSIARSRDYWEPLKSACGGSISTQLHNEFDCFYQSTPESKRPLFPQTVEDFLTKLERALLQPSSSVAGTVTQDCVSQALASVRAFREQK